MKLKENADISNFHGVNKQAFVIEKTAGGIVVKVVDVLSEKAQEKLVKCVVREDQEAITRLNLQVQ